MPITLKALTNESSRSLLGNFDAEGSGCVRLVGVALDGDVAIGKEGPVHAAVVLVSVIIQKKLINVLIQVSLL